MKTGDGHLYTAEGDFVKSLVSDQPADLTSSIAEQFRKSLVTFPDEAIYVYSFKEHKLLYANGWENILGYKDEELSLKDIVSITTEDYMKFANDLNDKSLHFLMTHSENLEEYAFYMELKKYHKDGSEVPMTVRVKVSKAEDGKVAEVIGRFVVNHNLKLGKVMTFAAYGPKSSKFEESLSAALFKHITITKKEKEALKLVSEGYSFKEIAHRYKVSQSAIEKRIRTMYKRFEVRSLSHLVAFAFENGIL